MGWFDWLTRRNGAEDSRTRQWRTDWAGGASTQPDAAAAAALRARLRRAAGLDDERFEIEREMLEGLEAVVELGATVAAHGPADDRDRPSRRRRRPLPFQRARPACRTIPAQPSGTLLLTNARAIFVGGAAGRDRSRGTRRRACPPGPRSACWSAPIGRTCTASAATRFADALRAAFLARHLAEAARIILGMSPTAPATPHRPGRHRTPPRRRPLAARRRARRPGLEPGIGRQRASATPPIASATIPAIDAGRAVRAAARLPVRPAGQHDRDAARARTRGGASRSIRSTARRASRPPEMLRDIDVLVIDLQDVGTRVYTYIYTMANCMRAAARHGVRVVVCDRPNPVGGDAVEGADARPGVRVVRRAVPDPAAPRHDHRRDRAPVQRGFRASAPRSTSSRWTAGGAAMYFDETGLPWVMPSPNIPTLDSAIVYPGAVLFEGTMLSEGRGHDAAVRADRRAVDRRRALADGDERARPARRALPAGRSSSRRSRSTRSRPAAAASCT